MMYSKKTVKHKKNNKNSQKTSKYKSSKRNTNANIKLKKTLKGGFVEEENFESTEQGLFDSLKVNSNSSTKDRSDPPPFPECCIL
jgi:hypothetical protein